MIASIFMVLLGCFIISIVVFGGAQMFIPYFKILLVNLLGVEQETWDSVLSIANATPGVFGLKVAFASGYLASCGEWWGYILMFGTYIIFILVPIFVMIFVMKKYSKIKDNKFMTQFLKVMKPIIAGILSSIIVNLFMSLIIPFVGFNDLGSYFGYLDKYMYLKKDSFFNEWRYWVLLGWSILSIPVDFYILKKYKINIILLIILNVILCMLLFQPWLK